MLSKSRVLLVCYSVGKSLQIPVQCGLVQYRYCTWVVPTLLFPMTDTDTGYSFFIALYSLETKILANGMQGILFSILWKHFEDVLFPKAK